MAGGWQRMGEEGTAMEMTKWFDTNYHYIVREWRIGQRFQGVSTKLFDEFAQAQAQDIPAKPVLIGPFSLVLLGKAHTPGLHLLGRTLAGVSALYREIISRLAAMGASAPHLDQPCRLQAPTPAQLSA